MTMNKRGTWLVYLAILFIVIMGFAAIFLKNLEAQDITFKTGEKQAQLLSTYTESEAIREYAKDSAQLAAAKIASTDFGSGENCFAGLDIASFSPKFKEEFNILLSDYKSPRQNFNVVFPEYDLKISNSESVLLTEGFGEDILITSDINGITYKASAYFKEELTCLEYAEYLKVLKDKQ